MSKLKSEYVSIAVGQFVVAFRDEYFNDTKTLAQNVEMLRLKGAGWDWCPDEILTVHLVSKVMPKTYLVYRNDDGAEFRESRKAIVATFPSEKEAEVCRRQLLAIGALADERIEAETARLIEPFAKAERTYALEQVKGLLPHIFGGRDVAA
ncbi:hypothetical protein J3U99_20635 [Brucella pituitosa]|uniref:hypothetical protein n=1 Tax=Brucella pituitosa TaxID=571256 RepID=UPI0020059CC1|nr:hypothetical protein [Brucella pituitosa]MCK4207179.1 hypothetical protein [Brucella pituitosa]